MKCISIIVPFYNEEKIIEVFAFELFKVIKTLDTYLFDVVFIDDGSTDGTLNLLKKQQIMHKEISVISFSRNFGHEAAINAGIDYCKGNAAIVMDADLQDPPSCIPELITKYEDGYDVVNVKRIDRSSDSLSKRVTAKLFYKLISHWSYKIKIVDNVNNFRLISERVIKVVKKLTSKNKVFRFEVPFAGFKITNIELIRPKRIGGKSHYNLSAMSRLAIDSIVSVSTQPLNLISKIFIVMFAIFCISTATEIILFAIQKLSNNIFISSAGYLSWLIINCALFLSLILLFGIAIIAQYVARIHLETQDRPTYIIDNIYTNRDA